VKIQIFILRLVKQVHRWYINKNNDNKYKIYRYVNFYNPQTKERIPVIEKEWMNDRDKLITDNIVQNMAYEEIWDRILEFIANYTTTKNIFNYTSENISENTSENYPKPETPISPLTLPEEK
jgi:hypothetical protein